MRSIILPFLIILLEVVVIQGQEVEYENYSNIKNPSKVKELSINCYSDDFNDFILKVHLFKNLDILHISNYENKYFPEEIKQLNFSKLIISNSPEIDFSLLFKLLQAIKSLDVLVLDNNQLNVVPNEINQISNLKSLEIINNEGLNTENLVETVRELKSLKELNIALNLITDLPKNIGDLKTLESLNISCNNLNDLPKEVKFLESLDTLRIEENNFIDQIESLNKLKNIDLKLISLDKGITDENRLILNKLFPNAKIEEKDVSFPKIADINLPAKISEDTVVTNDLKFGKITVEGIQFKAFSNAYYHYPRIFNNRRFEYNFDTLMFSERYADVSYALTSKIQTNASFDYLNIYKRSWFLSKKIQFDIAPKHKPGKTYKLFPELRTFNNMTWIYKGEMSKKEFKRKYINKYLWTDMRIYFDDINKDFTIELKSSSGFSRFIAYPLIKKNVKNKNTQLIDSQKKYVHLYTRYSKELDNRSHRFHLELERNKKSYEQTREKAINKIWIDFQKTYMSVEEKKMTKGEWLEYYDKIIANERKALSSSTASIKIMTRSLDIEKYIYNDIDMLIDNSYTPIAVSFYNNSNEKLPIKSFIVIDIKDRSYYSFEGNLGIDLQSVFLANSDIAIVAELRNGNIGYITKENMAKLELDPDKEVIIPLTIIEKSLCTIGQLYDLLGL